MSFCIPDSSITPVIAVNFGAQPFDSRAGPLQASAQLTRFVRLFLNALPMRGGLAPPAIEDEEREEVAAGRGVIFVLENAQLETAQVGKAYVLLNCDDHASFLKKHKKDPALYRPDICHQAMLAILDSPLNKAGRRLRAAVAPHTAPRAVYFTRSMPGIVMDITLILHVQVAEDVAAACHWQLLRPSPNLHNARGLLIGLSSQ